MPHPSPGYRNTLILLLDSKMIPRPQFPVTFYLTISAVSYRYPVDWMTVIQSG